MRPAFLGTSEFAAEVLRELAASRHRPTLVVTPPDRRRGRGRRSGPAPAARVAQELGIEVLKTDAVCEPGPSARIAAVGEPYAVVCAFGQLIREPLLSDVPMLNVHPSLLPRWRGAAPIERCLMAGDARTGVSIMRLTEGLDAGPVAAREALDVPPRATYGELAPVLASLGARLIVEALDDAEAGSLALAEQDESQATYAEKVEARERRLDPTSETAAELDRRRRALTPHIGAHLELAGGARLGVLESEPLERGPSPGNVVVEHGGLVIGCVGGGALEVGRVRPAGGREMDAAAYLRGHPAPRLAGT